MTGVEIVPEAVESARESARLNGLDNCDFICGDVLKVVDELPEKPDLIVLDPPREGINPKAMIPVRRRVWQETCSRCRWQGTELKRCAGWTFSQVRGI